MRGAWPARVTQTAKTPTMNALILDIFPPSFLDQDLNSLLCKKRKHHQSAQGVAGAYVHAGVQQECNQEHQGEIGIAESKNRGGLQGLIPQLHCERFQVGTD